MISPAFGGGVAEFQSYVLKTCLKLWFIFHMLLWINDKNIPYFKPKDTINLNSFIWKDFLLLYIALTGNLKTNFESENSRMLVYFYLSPAHPFPSVTASLWIWNWKNTFIFHFQKARPIQNSWKIPIYEIEPPKQSCQVFMKLL